MNPLSVGDLTRYISDLIATDDLLADVWIEGEVIEATVSRAGHCYFAIADDVAKLKCVIFRGALQRQSYPPTAGQSCAVHGAVSIYAREGQYQLIADFVQPAGIGLAALELELLKQQLAAEGLFDAARKRPLPFRIRTVGLVTSAEGAVRHDVETVLRRRNPFLHLILAHAAVQGDAAAASLQAALRMLIEDGQSDVIIIGRGGGSASDLAAFNDEALVRAVFASPVPVISAVGHESDWTLLDLVADLRAATPSAAAEIVSAPVAGLVQQVAEALDRHRLSTRRHISERFLDVDARRESLSRRGPAGRLTAWRAAIGERALSLEAQVRSAVQARAAQASGQRDLLFQATQAFHQSRGLDRDRAIGLLSVLDPHATLARGYAVLEDAESGVPMLSVTEARLDQTLRARLRDGSIITRVESIG
ncbi:MAG: exodeoxyribonuclease VII large subunit [Thermomicrobiales bacterium]